MEPFGYDRLPEVVRQLFEKVENLEKLVSTLAPAEQEPQMLTVAGAAEFLNLTPQALYTMVSRKEIPVHKPGKRLYFDKQDLVEWIRSGRKGNLAEKERFQRPLRPAVRRR